MKQRLVVIAIGVALVSTACGDKSTEDTAAPGPVATQGGTASSSASANTAPPSTTADEAPTDSNETFYGNPVGTAVVEIGQTRYEFDLDVICLTMFGSVGVVGTATDGSGSGIDADFPPQDWETDTTNEWDSPFVKVDDKANDISWAAGGEGAEMWAPGATSVEFTSDGSRVFGEATFVNLFVLIDDQTPVNGRFEMACPQG